MNIFFLPVSSHASSQKDSQSFELYFQKVDVNTLERSKKHKQELIGEFNINNVDRLMDEVHKQCVLPSSFSSDSSYTLDSTQRFYYVEGKDESMVMDRQTEPKDKADFFNKYLCKHDNNLTSIQNENNILCILFGLPIKLDESNRNLAEQKNHASIKLDLQKGLDLSDRSSDLQTILREKLTKRNKLSDHALFLKAFTIWHNKYPYNQLSKTYNPTWGTIKDYEGFFIKKRDLINSIQYDDNDTTKDQGSMYAMMNAIKDKGNQCRKSTSSQRLKREHIKQRIGELEEEIKPLEKLKQTIEELKQKKQKLKEEMEAWKKEFIRHHVALLSNRSFGSIHQPTTNTHSSQQGTLYHELLQNAVEPNVNNIENVNSPREDLGQLMNTNMTKGLDNDSLNRQLNTSNDSLDQDVEQAIKESLKSQEVKLNEDKGAINDESKPDYTKLVFIIIGGSLVVAGFFYLIFSEGDRRPSKKFSTPPSDDKRLSVPSI